MITANLTVYREPTGTLHLPNGSLLPVNLDCALSSRTFKATLLTVILKTVSEAPVEQTRWSTGCFVATKIINACTGSFTYVAEALNDVTGLQNPCCLGSGATVSTPDPVYVCPAATISSTGTGNIHVAFTAAGSKSYIVHLYSNADGSTQVTQSSFTNGSSSPVSATKDFNSLSPGTYYVEVRESASSTPCTITQYILAAPSYVCPSDVVVTAVSDHAHITYTAGAGKSYTLYCWNDSAGTSLNGGTGAQSNYDVSPAALTYNFYRADGTYYIEVRETGSTTPCTKYSVTLATAITAQWDAFDTEPTDLAAISFTHSQAHVAEADLSFTITGLGPNKWIVARYPASESDYLHWYNTTPNSGDIPDSNFQSIVTISGKKYIKSRVAITLDPSHPLNFTH